ncbi:hypothetical protein DW2_00090 [Thioclava atlantica]|uniref:Uncharacterized protein n=1 Tax=Thioclava atlantica TaxID=1317124 RepID=A0A085U0L3_9RHOB|nr:hypothetical protein DW2_00090 [Thioclava atlantica]
MLSECPTGCVGVRNHIRPRVPRDCLDTQLRARDVTIFYNERTVRPLSDRPSRTAIIQTRAPFQIAQRSEVQVSEEFRRIQVEARSYAIEFSKSLGVDLFMQQPLRRKIFFGRNVNQTNGTRLRDTLDCGRTHLFGASSLRLPKPARLSRSLEIESDHTAHAEASSRRVSFSANRWQAAV